MRQVIPGWSEIETVVAGRLSDGPRQTPGQPVFTIIILSPAATGIIVAMPDRSRTITPHPGHPNPAVHAIHPITRHPNKIHARTGENRLNRGPRHRRDLSYANRRRGNDGRQWQPDGKAEADSGVGGHGCRAQQRGQEKYFGFHSMIYRRYCLTLFRRTSNYLVRDGLGGYTAKDASIFESPVSNETRIPI